MDARLLFSFELERFFLALSWFETVLELSQIVEFQFIYNDETQNIVFFENSLQ